MIYERFLQEYFDEPRSNRLNLQTETLYSLHQARTRHSIASGSPIFICTVAKVGPEIAGEYFYQTTRSSVFLFPLEISGFSEAFSRSL